jgi:SpoVK/Ycf46/Vps4 family AAA+-type ATPase
MELPSSDLNPLIFEHQTAAFEKLVSAGRVCFSLLRENLPIQPRTSSLIVGPTGTGKTFLANAVAASLGVHCKHLSVAEWMLIGTSSRGAARTWNSIFDFLVQAQNKRGAMIFLDEIDKLTGTSDWCQHLRMEVFRLLDRVVPPDLADSDDKKQPEALFTAVADVLKHKTFIVAAGAFQDFWDSLGNQVGGFAGEPKADIPSSDRLSNHLARELINRFRADIVLLPSLGPRDYENILLAAADKMPESMQERFLSLGTERLFTAHANRQGVRFLEELVADVLGEHETVQPSRWKTHSQTTPGPGV